MISSTCVLSLFPKLQLFFSECRIFDRQNMHFLERAIACSSFGIERSEIHEEKLRTSDTLGIKWSVGGRDLHHDRGILSGFLDRRSSVRVSIWYRGIQT
jgi:hypothetical protein